MKVVHLCTLDTGGAAASALRLHQGLSHFGIGSSVLVLKSKGQDQAVRTVPMRRARKDADSWQVLITRWQSMLRRYPQRPSDMELFSGPRADVDLLSHPEIRDADIINLHWVAGLVDIPMLPKLAVNKTVVWTLHDMNPLTGGCHFSGGCRRFEHGCGACPQLGSTDEADISAAYCAEKTSAYAAADFTVISPSRWLAEQARSSSCMSGKPVLTIPYGLDHTIFAPQPALPIRRLLQLEAEDFIILYGADYACIRKGGDAAFRLLSSLPQTMHGRRVVLATFGAPQPGLAKTGLKHLDLGYLNSPQLMAQVYAMADVLLMPTLEDNLPNTVLESMGCGTPVVGFATGGMPDMVEHGNNGWLAEPQDIDGLRKGIENVLIAGSQTREAARQTILRKFTLSHQARAYLRVYADLLATTRALQSAIDIRTGQPIPESAHAHSWLDGMPGIEIGPAAHNPFGLDTINAGLYHPGYDKEQLQRTGSIAPLHIESPADCLPLPSETENFILHSHVLEHCPDLIRAMLEWYRVLKPQGLLYMIVPKRDAAPSDRGKPISTWKHFLQDFTNRQTHEKEPNAGAFGYCHYHVFSNRTLQGVVRQIFGDRMELCDMLETDDKAGNGFTLVYRKVKALQESFPWVIGDHGSRHHLRLQICGGREVIDVEQPRQHEPATRMPAASRNPAMAGNQNDVIATVATPIVDACRQAQLALKEPLLLAVAAFPATNPDSLSRQQACLSCLAALRHTGLHTVIPCLKQEQEALNDLFPEITTEPLLRNSADVRLQVPGASKPFVDEYFDAACMLAEREGYEWFGFANSDVLFTPLLIAHLKRCMHQNLQSVVVSRTELPGLDADGRPIAGYLEFAGYDAFFCRVDWWREHRHLFAPYIIGERAWDDAYASIMLANARCELLWEQGALWHPEHERRWNLENTVYGNWNMNLYSGRDRDYARRFEAFLEDLIAAGTKPLPDGEDRTRLLKRNFTEAAVVQGDPKRFVNIVMVTYNRLSFTRQAIGSILRTADWPYCITVVDNRSEDGTQDYLRELQRKKLINTLILNEENKGVAVAANQGWIAEPEAQYTLKYDNDIVMQRNDWLGNMVKTAEAISQTGTLAYNFEPKSYSLEVINGHRVRPKHNGLNLGGACLLVPKRAEKILGFWSEEYGLYGEEDADYGYRSYLAGLLNLYMEDEDAGIHLPGGKAASIDLETYDALDESERHLHQEYRIFKDNLRRKNMKKGGLFYRNKKLYDNGIKPVYINPFEIDIQKKINIAVYPLDKSIDACAHYRILSPLGRLADHIEISWNENFSPEKIHSFKDNAQNADIILIQRFFPCSETAEFINFLFSLGKPVIYEIDDLLTDLPMDNPSFGWSRTRKKFILDVARRASAVTVSTAALKDYFSKYNDAVFLLPNYIDSGIWANQLPGQKRAAPLRIGYAGTVTHKYDLKIIANALALISKKYGSSVSFLFFGCHIEELRSIPNSTFIDHDKSYHNYSKVIAKLNLDILLIPLADSEFNNAKSNIKWLEYASLGVPGIYSNVKPYSEYITNPSFGLLADNTTEGWFKCICRLIEDDGLRETISFSARSEVLASHDISRHAHKWLTTYRSIIKRHALKKPAPLQQNVPVAPTTDPITVISFHISGARNSSQFLRQIAPLQGLEKTGHVRIIDGQKLLRRKGSSYSLDTTTLPQDTIVFLQRDFSAYEFLFETGLPLIYDLDDNLLELPAEHPDLQQYQRLSELLKTYLHRFAAVMVPTENLRRLCAPFNPNTHVIPNFIPLVPEQIARPEQKIRILVSGTRSHLKDAEFLVPVIESICAEVPNTVEFIFWGYCPDKLKQHPNIRFKDTFVDDYPTYLLELASVQADIGLIPLAFTWFNSFKSDIKWKEYAICNMASIASNTDPYQTIRHGEDGFLTDNSPQAWKELLIRLINDKTLRTTMAQAAAARVRSNFMLSNNFDTFADALRALHVRNTEVLPEVSIIIPVFNKKELTHNCLDALLNLPARHEYEVIVIDNASTDGTNEHLSHNFPACKIITNKENLGFAQACNQGAQIAIGRDLIFLNNDTIPQQGWLDNLVECLKRHRDAGIVGCKLLYADDTIQHCGASMKHDGAFFRHQYKYLHTSHPLVNVERELDAVTAACFITPRKLFLELDMFDTRYSNGCEDMDYCSKVRRAGYRILYTPFSVLYHLESQTPRPQNKDKENFALYLSKWGAGFMKNEIEIYTEDGFWSEENGIFRRSSNQNMSEFTSALKNAISSQDTTVIFHYKTIIDRIYPSDTWAKPLDNSVPTHSDINCLKVLFVCHDFPPYRFAGAQMYALHLAQAINQSGKGHVEIFYPVFRNLKNKNYSIHSKTYNGIIVHELFKPKVEEMEKVYDEKAARSFELFLDQHHFDVVHFHGLGQLSFALPLVAHSKNIPTVLTLHDYWFLCDHWHMIRRDQSICSGPQSLNTCTQCHIVDNDLPASNDMEELVLRYHRTRKNIALKTFQTFDFIQAPSNYLKKTFEKFGFPGIQVFPLGLAAQPSISLDNPQTKTLTFGYMGQLILRKGINFLLDAFKETPGDIRLLIWGDYDTPQPYQMRIREMAKRDPRVRLMGKYEPTQLPSIFNQIDVAVIPSLMENYPITALEALHYKTPVIASRTGGIPEIVIHRENGLLFEAGSVSELKKALTEIVNNPELITTFRKQIKPVRTIGDDANETINAYLTLNINQSNPSNDAYSRKRPLTVQFYVYKNVHWPMFESLFEYLRDRNDVREIVICLPNLPNLTSSGTNHHLVEKLLILGARIVTDPRKANADVTFIADTIAGKVHGCGRIVNVGHGTISKGYYFTDNVWTERENWVDLLCVPGEFARERMSAILKTKVVATGMPKLDPVFSGHHTKSALCSALGLNPSKKIVLYAPTFNLNLSSVFAFADSFHRLDSPDRYVLIKLHGSTLPHLIEQYRRIAKNSKQIIFVENNNIAPYIGGADIMISDVSSAFMEFMALNKPVILYDNPGWGTYHGYDPENIEYAWRDLGTRINSFEELPPLLDRLMVQSDGKEPIRQKYAAELFADRSGQACENVWKETLHLTQAPVANPLPVFSVVIHVEQDAHILLRSLAHDLQFNSVMPVELILVATEGALPEGFVNPLLQFNEFVHVKLIHAPQNLTAEKAVALGVNASTGDFICVLREDVALFKNFDYMLYKTFKAHPEIVLLTGLTNLALPGINSNQYLANERSEALDGLAYRFINQFKGIEIAHLCDQPSIPPLVVYRKKSIDLSAGDLLPALKSLIAQGKAAICLSLFYLSLDSAFRASLLKIWRRRSSFNAHDRIKIMSDIVSHLSCPDMSEAMVRDAMQLALPKSQYRQGIANSLHARFYDTEHKAWLTSILDANDPWAKSLQADCRIINALKAATQNHGRVVQEQNKPRFMFYFFKNVHIPILLPLYHALKAQSADVEIAFSYLPPSPHIRAGLLPDEVRIIEQAGVPIHATPQEFNPNLTFIADSVYPWVEGCGKLMHVGHGVLSKGQYYTDTPTARREELADMVCVPGKHHQAIMRRIISKPVVATGMCKLDDLFSGKISRASVIKQFGLPDDYRYVLFAPTFNDELSAIPFVQDRIGQVLPDDKTLLIIKLHPSTKPEYKEMYRALPNTNKRVIFADELDITPFLALCDVMISDVSSAMMEFAALDKPVILFNNPNWTSYQNYNPADIEFQWRDIGVQVSDLDEMRAAVSLCLQEPGLHADKRKKYTDLLFANKRGGNAAERIVKLTLSLLEAEQDR